MCGLAAGESYIADIARIASAPCRKRARCAHLVAGSLADADVAIICVLHRSASPRILIYRSSAAVDLARFRHQGMLVILESTTYPGTTRRFCFRVFSRMATSSARMFCGFFPGTCRSGNKQYTINNTPKVVGGVTQCLPGTGSLHTIVERTVPVSPCNR